MRKRSAIFASAVFLVLAPGSVAGLVPWWISSWHLQDPFLGSQMSRVVGVLLILVGAPGLLDSFLRFAVAGLGTPAPVLPTRHLVVSGLYRYVRKPMYVAVVSLVLGQALLFGNRTLLAYGALVFLFCHLFVLLYEEPVLKAAYGAEYDLFRAHVPRWIPRIKPWNAASQFSTLQNSKNEVR